jgi:16S rRNA (cytidine1402-2'-O)-methyltransferase
MSYELILIPTPIADGLPLEPVAKQMLLESALEESVMLLVEEPKAMRKRWLSWGLPRESIEKFVFFNEHTHAELLPQVLNHLKKKGKAYLISDCGLPVFCDPGQELVDACHRAKISINCSPFPHSVALALALSGFNIKQYLFSGWIPRKPEERERFLKSLAQEKMTCVVMDTAYRLSSLLEEMKEMEGEFFLAMDLNKPTQRLMRGKISSLQKGLDGSKKEFILIKNSHV